MVWQQAGNYATCLSVPIAIHVQANLGGRTIVILSVQESCTETLNKSRRLNVYMVSA